MISQADFARMMGLSRAAISKAVKVGRVPVYDETGRRVGPEFEGRKLVKPDEARQAFALSRARIDDAALAEAAAALEAELAADGLTEPGAATAATAAAAPGTDPAAEPQGGGRNSASRGGSLAAAKTESEELKAELLRIRIERERGDLVKRAAVLAALETAGRRAGREVLALPLMAEELVGLAHTGGVPAVSAFLRTKATVMATALADALAAGADEDVDDGDPEPDELP